MVMSAGNPRIRGLIPDHSHPHKEPPVTGVPIPEPDSIPALLSRGTVYLTHTRPMPRTHANVDEGMAKAMALVHSMSEQGKA